MSLPCVILVMACRALAELLVRALGGYGHSCVLLTVTLCVINCHQILSLLCVFGLCVQMDDAERATRTLDSHVHSVFSFTVVTPVCLWSLTVMSLTCTSLFGAQG